MSSLGYQLACLPRLALASLVSFSFFPSLSLAFSLFPWKVINAQKLGAKAVLILNTDDKKTMRLSALPDEVRGMVG